ncbi:MAG: cupredoxin domain-containing protein [Ardenticatenaceae bacterium]|nr:cupredoxin domain-containing protein [Anaerolineales bacterium]MCB8938727.1 cupredoxin domain-containing protein [Ardenticatenaceae bacterium]MCB8973963.1 cupredoxin domain-containing protein [Ardenticatenaceae bacterium]
MKLRPFLTSLILFLLLVACAKPQTSRVTLTLQEMGFSQNEIEVSANQPVTLHLNNKDGYAHAFDLDEFDIHLKLAAAETAEITFTPTRSGTFTFYCSSPGHQAAGMAGSLVVVP